MIFCDWCSNQIAGVRFCNPAHKMRYRRNKHVKKSIVPDKKQNKEDVLVESGEAQLPINKVAFRKTLCKKHKIFTCGCSE